MYKQILIERIEHGSSLYRIVLLVDYTERSDRRIFPKLKPLGSPWEDLSNDMNCVKIQRLDLEKFVKQIWVKTAPRSPIDMKCC